MKPAPPVTRSRIRGRLAAREWPCNCPLQGKAVQLAEALREAVAPVRESRRARSLAAQDRLARTRGGAPELLGRDAPHAAVDARLLEDRNRKLRPRAVAVRGDVPDAAREVA